MLIGSNTLPNAANALTRVVKHSNQLQLWLQLLSHETFIECPVVYALRKSSKTVHPALVIKQNNKRSMALKNITISMHKTNISLVYRVLYKNRGHACLQIRQHYNQGISTEVLAVRLGKNQSKLLKDTLSNSFIHHRVDIFITHLFLPVEVKKL